MKKIEFLLVLFLVLTSIPARAQNYVVNDTAKISNINIFCLTQANRSYSDFLDSIEVEYNEYGEIRSKDITTVLPWTKDEYHQFYQRMKKTANRKLFEYIESSAYYCAKKDNDRCFSVYINLWRIYDPITTDDNYAVILFNHVWDLISLKYEKFLVLYNQFDAKNKEVYASFLD